MTPHDRPQLMTTIDHGQCCGYQGQYYNVGDRIPLAHKCAWLECRSDSFVVLKYDFICSKIVQTARYDNCSQSRSCLSVQWLWLLSGCQQHHDSGWSKVVNLIEICISVLILFLKVCLQQWIRSSVLQKQPPYLKG